MQNRENYTIKMFLFYIITGQYLSLKKILLGFNFLLALQGLEENGLDTSFANWIFKVNKHFTKEYYITRIKWAYILDKAV